MFNVGNETHVEHPVGFVDDQHFATRQQNLAAFKQVHQAARGRDQYINALFKRFDLIAHLHTADQQRHRQLVIFAVFFEILGDLRRQFAGWLQNEAAWHARARAAIGEHIDHRQDKACGFSRARLRNGNDVAHHLDLRDGGGLNGGWLIIASLA